MTAALEAPSSPPESSEPKETGEPMAAPLERLRDLSKETLRGRLPDIQRDLKKHLESPDLAENLQGVRLLSQLKEAGVTLKNDAEDDNGRLEKMQTNLLGKLDKFREEGNASQLGIYLGHLKFNGFLETVKPEDVEALAVGVELKAYEEKGVFIGAALKAPDEVSLRVRKINYDKATVTFDVLDNSKSIRMYHLNDSYELIGRDGNLAGGWSVIMGGYLVKE